jgi:hypothetical protein
MIISRLAATAPEAEHRADYSQKESPPDRCTTQCHESISSQPLQARRVTPLCRLDLARGSSQGRGRPGEASTPRGFRPPSLNRDSAQAIPTADYFFGANKYAKRYAGRGQSPRAIAEFSSVRLEGILLAEICDDRCSVIFPGVATARRRVCSIPRPKGD